VLPGPRPATHARIVLGSTPTILAVSAEPIQAQFAPRLPGPAANSAAACSTSARTYASALVRSTRTLGISAALAASRAGVSGRRTVTDHSRPVLEPCWRNAACSLAPGGGGGGKERPSDRSFTSHTLHAVRCLVNLGSRESPGRRINRYLIVTRNHPTITTSDPKIGRSTRAFLRRPGRRQCTLWNGGRASPITVVSFLHRYLQPSASQHKRRPPVRAGGRRQQSKPNGTWQCTERNDQT
jgi:hypothetical protein